MILRILLITLILKVSIFACADGWGYEHKDFVFLEKRVLPFANFSEDLNSASTYNDILYKYNKEVKELNIKEWQDFLGKDFTKKEIEEFIYKRENLEKIKNPEVLEYLNFVKEQEPYATSDYYYYKKYSYNKKLFKDAKKPEELITIALAKLEKTNSLWLKQRYFYLAFRLAHFYKKQPLDIYNKYYAKLFKNSNTIIKDWVQGLYAGALIKNSNIVKGVYEFTKLFEEDTINWHLSFYNFHHIKTNKQWNELLSYAKDDEEKIKFFTLRALHKNANLIEELKNIESINVNSKWYDLLLYRALLDSQHYFDNFQGYERNFQSKKFIQYLTNVKKKNMHLVNLSLAYYNYFEKKPEKAKIYLSKIIDSKENIHEAEVLDYILYLDSIKNIDIKTENIIYKKMEHLIKNHGKSNNIQVYTFKKLVNIFKEDKQNFKSFLSSQYQYREVDNFTLERFNKYEKFITSKKESKLQEYLAKKLEKQNKDISLKNTEVKLLVNNLKFQEALNTKHKSLNTKVQFSPFNVHIKGNNRAGTQNQFTLKQILQKLVVIQKELKKNPNSPMDNYLYANALYNLSFAGNSDILTTVYRSTYSYKDIELQKQKLNDSIKYYKKAIQNAKNKEFKSKITYMLAKSELALFDIKASKHDGYGENRYSFNRTWMYNQHEIYKKYLKKGYGKFFDKLKEDYGNTKYYQELIKECSNLRVYEKAKTK